jgi:hypothetical protein
MCGHALSAHAPIGPRTLRPPSCGACARCPGFRYAPSRPEEVGQWWLPRRKDFNLKQWQARLRVSPHDYACIGCDRRVSEHSIHIESTRDREARGLSTGAAFLPLTESPLLQSMVLGTAGPRGGASRGPPLRAGGEGALPSPEDLFERGLISAEEYRMRVATEEAGAVACSTVRGGSGGPPSTEAAHRAAAVLRTSSGARAAPTIAVLPLPGAATTLEARGLRGGSAASGGGSVPVIVTNIGVRPTGPPGTDWMRQRPPQQQQHAGARPAMSTAKRA